MTTKKPKKKFKKLIFFSIIILIILATLIFYFLKYKKDQQVAPETITVQRGNITEVVKATGEVYATELVSVGAQVSGQVQKLYIKLGQEVEKGDLIAEIDSKTQLDKLNTAKAEIESSKADLAARKMALETSKKNYQRKLKLFQQDAGSKEELELAENQLKQDQSSVESTQFRLKRLQIDVNTAQTELGYTQIRSPLTGTVVSLPIEAGQTINFAQTTPLIAMIANLDKMEIRMQIAEGDYTKLKPNMGVRFSTLANPNVKHKGYVRSIDPALVTLTKGTYNEKGENANSAVYYYARMIVENTERVLSIGMTTQNDIVVNEKNNIITVPKTAIYDNDGEVSVSIYTKDKKIQNRKIKTGISDFNQIEVVQGLKEGEKILSEYQVDNVEKPGVHS